MVARSGRAATSRSDHSKIPSKQEEEGDGGKHVDRHEDAVSAAVIKALPSKLPETNAQFRRDWRRKKEAANVAASAGYRRAPAVPDVPLKFHPG